MLVAVTIVRFGAERDSAGEKLYERVGYTHVGVIPGFALNHDGTKLIDAVLFYKRLK